MGTCDMYPLHYTALYCVDSSQTCSWRSLWYLLWIYVMSRISLLAEDCKSHQVYIPRGDSSCSWVSLFMHWVQFWLNWESSDCYRAGGEATQATCVCQESKIAPLVKCLHWWRTKTPTLGIVHKFCKIAGWNSQFTDTCKTTNCIRKSSSYSGGPNFGGACTHFTVLTHMRTVYCSTMEVKKFNKHM